MKHLLIIPLLLAVAQTFGTQAFGADFTVLRAQQSNIAFVSKQMGVPVDGIFKKFTARITVDPAKPEAGRAVRRRLP